MNATALPLVLLALVLTLPAGVLAGATGGRDAARPKQDLEAVQRRIRSIEESLQKAEGSRAETTDALQASERSISDIQRRLHTLGNDREALQKRLADVQQQAGQTAARIDRQRQQVVRLLRSTPLQSEDDALRLLLQGGDPHELRRDLAALARIGSARQQSIERLRQELDSFAALQSEVIERQTALERLTAEQRAEASRLEREKREHARKLAQLGRDIEQRRKQIDTLKRDEQRLSRLLQELEKARTAPPPPRKPAKPAKPGQAPAPLVVDELPQSGLGGQFAALKGKLRLPVRGEVVNRFGSPRADTGLAWKGLMIRADAGSPVLAIAPGKIAYADWLRGFGNLLIIDHGDGYMSLYGNNEALLRQAGETVASGDTIARVGRSGGGDGDGLYFELRRAGTPIDPLTWVGR